MVAPIWRRLELRCFLAALAVFLRASVVDTTEGEPVSQ
jgi:hypothetical protein